MSTIGNNIKKIRSIKKLNQQDFADNFGIKRASVGAYEEGRADPKIKTIIEIANYFGISLDLFMTKELTVNDLYRFDLFREDLKSDTTHNLTPRDSFIDILSVPFVSSTDIKNYYDKTEDSIRLQTLNVLKLPLKAGGTFRAFEVLDNKMTSHTGGIDLKDIFIGERPKGFDIPQIEIGKVYLFELNEEHKIRRVVAKNMSQITLKGDSDDSYQENINIKKIRNVWQCSHIITNKISNQINFANEIKRLNEDVRLLKLKINR